MAIGHGDARALGDAADELALGHLLVRVATYDVADLVAEDARELVFIFELFKEGSSDENLATRQGEGVDGF